MDWLLDKLVDLRSLPNAPVTAVNALIDSNSNEIRIEFSEREIDTGWNNDIEETFLFIERGDVLFSYRIFTDNRQRVESYGVVTTVNGKKQSVNDEPSDYYINNLNGTNGSICRCDTIWENDGKRHRFNGPATLYELVIRDEKFYTKNFKSKERTRNYYIKGNFIGAEKYSLWLTENGIDVNNITPEDEQIILMKWG